MTLSGRLPHSHVPKFAFNYRSGVKLENFHRGHYIKNKILGMGHMKKYIKILQTTMECVFSPVPMHALGGPRPPMHALPAIN